MKITVIGWNAAIVIMALLQAEVTSKPTTEALTGLHQRLRKTEDLKERADGVRHSSIKMQGHLLKHYINSPEAKSVALSMTFVSLKHIELSPKTQTAAHTNPDPVLHSHQDIVSLLIKYTEHMNTSGEIKQMHTTPLQKRQTNPDSATLKNLLNDTIKALKSLHLDIEIYASAKQEDNAVEELSTTFVGLGNKLHNEALRAFGIAADIEKAMDRMYMFYKDHYKALAEDSV